MNRKTFLTTLAGAAAAAIGLKKSDAAGAQKILPRRANGAKMSPIKWTDHGDYLVADIRDLNPPKGIVPEEIICTDPIAAAWLTSSGQAIFLNSYQSTIGLDGIRREVWRFTRYPLITWT